MRVSNLLGPETLLSLESDVFAFLATLPPRFFDRFYGHSASCLAVFRSLPNLAKLYILRVLFLTSPLTLAIVQTWHRKESKNKHNQALRALRKLYILNDADSTTSEGPIFSLHSQFQTHLIQALLGGSENSFGDTIPMKFPVNDALGVVDVEGSHVEVSTSFLSQYSNEKWETILHFMIGTSDVDVPPNVIALLLSAELMLEVSGNSAEDDETLNNNSSHLSDDDEYSEGSQKRKKKQKQKAPKRKEEPTMLRITQLGFRFLLQDTRTQMWMLLLKYIQHAEAVEIDPCEALQFLFMLSNLIFGNAYHTANLTPTQKQVVQELVHLGLVFMNDENAFYPTEMATQLTQIEDTKPSEVGFLIIETNYRVYAYTNSPIQIAILSLLCTLHFRFGNMIVASITRESVHEALRQGITGDQMIAYFYTHAHPQMRIKSPILPPTVVDQIRLWEMERHRMKSAQAMAYHEFEDAKDYEAVRQYADQMGILLLAHPGKKLIFARPDGHVAMRAFIKRQLTKKEQK